MTDDDWQQLYESPDGMEILRPAMRSSGRLLLHRTPAHPGALVDAEGWRPLAVPAEVPYAAVRSCVRCRRLNFGPCISATCTDLQVGRW